MTAMDVEELIARHPHVYHTMSATAWPSVQQHGLLSTQRLIGVLNSFFLQAQQACPRFESVIFAETEHLIHVNTCQMQAGFRHR
jgi:hypothetical protein